jgi:putative DNA primase/helicase
MTRVVNREGVQRQAGLSVLSKQWATPGRVEAQRLLESFTAPGEAVTFQTFDDTLNKRRDLARIVHGTLEDAALWNELERLNQRNAGVFWTVNATDGKGRKVENVTRVRAVFADLDGAPLEPVTACELPPTAIIESSQGRWHAYWKVLDVPLEAFEDLQRGVAARFSGDPKIKDLPRVMRLAGFLHQKGEAYRSRLLELHPEQVYTLEQVRAAFPVPRSETSAAQTTPTPKHRTVTGGDSLEAYVKAALEAECDAVRRASEGTGNDTINKAAFALGQLVGAGALPEGTARAGLEEAVNSWATPDPGAGRTIDSGLEAGKKEPRDLTGVAQRYGDTQTSAAPVRVLEPVTWADLEPLPPELPTAPSLPREMIPESLRGWLEDAAATACVPLEVLTVPALIAASGVIGRSVEIHPRNFSNWIAAPNLWGAIVAPPGAMKSDMLGEALRPVSALEKNAREAHKAAMLEAAVEHDQLEAEYSGLKQKAKKGSGDKNAMLEIKQRLAALENRPRKRYTTSDATCEKLGELLCDNQRGVILTRDELASWIASMEREENQNARGFFLTAWNGTSSYTFDRIGRGTIDIPAVCVSVLGAIQPSPLRAVFSRLQEDETRSDGLLQRFQLFVYPDGLPAWQAPHSWPNRTARDAALEVFKRLDALERCDAETGDLEPRVLRFSSDAQTVFDDWHDALEHRLRGGEDARTPHFHSHLAKYRSLAPSLAVVFHLLELAAHPNWNGWPDLPPVTLEALELALNWTDFLEIHARKVYAAELNRCNLAAHALARRIAEGTVSDGTPLRTLQRNEWSGLKGAALQGALATLEALNWVRVETLEPQGGKGGRPSEVVRVNPAAMSAAREAL